MSKFADYSPRDAADPRPAPPIGLVIRRAEPGDLLPVAQIVAERDGGDVATHRSGLEREFARTREGTDLAIWVAALEGQVVAYARAVRFVASSDAPADTVPGGWYLMGVVVSPGLRRRGIGELLTRVRLEWLADRTDVVRYVANASNGPTIDLHARLGFREVTRRFTFPGVTFTGGIGVLFEMRYVPARRIFDHRMPDGSRNFADLPESYDANRPQWHRLRARVAALEGAAEVRFVTDDVTEAWIVLRYRGHEFSLNNQCGDWWLFVEDPDCPDEILEEVRRHFAQVTGESA